ncbi:alkaline phosphatase [Modestobacter marinus]|uniref:alkaline phosphatase n=1 Tax=Modestobacter marinus TaxID=477641 RepID=UPI001C95F47B|nr:alkaline phosphatase [Modestobacter marinus]
MSTSTSRRSRGLPTALAATLVGGLVLLPSCLAPGDEEDDVRSVIFVNGDGMAAAHREAGRLDQQGFDGQLAMDSLAVAGLQTTDPRDPLETVTDSAAGASAWATGVKTFNGGISVDVDGNPLPTIGAQAAEAGLATGLVTTAQVTDATPAAFFSSTTDRALQDQIAGQYLEVNGPQVILGGGEDWWLPAGDEGAFPPRTGDAEDPEVSRSQQGDLLAQAEGLGYVHLSDAAGLAAAEGDRLLGLFANEEMFQMRAEGRGDEYSPVVPLADMTAKALDVLSEDEDGFFLLVEEEGVDEMAHHNNGTRMLQAMRALDDAVQVAREYVAEHPDTLLVVTGDHETGGLTIEDVDAKDESGPGGTLDGTPAPTQERVSGEDGPFPVAGSDRTFVLDWTSSQHTGAPTVVTAEGPGSEALTGSYRNTRLYEVLSDALLD